MNVNAVEVRGCEKRFNWREEFHARQRQAAGDILFGALRPDASWYH